MENIFLPIVKMSISASVVALVVLIIRWLLGNKFHKSFSYALWALVFIRLVLPYSIPSVVSIFNKVPIPSTLSTESKSYSMNQTITSSKGTVSTSAEVHTNKAMENSDLISTFNKDYYDSIGPVDIFITFMSYVWFLGVIILLANSILAYLKINNTLQDSVLYKNDALVSQCGQQLNFHRNIKIYTSDKINSPLVCGLLKPHIILPLSVTDQCSQAELSHFVCHELVHIKRFDYIMKPLSFLALTIHWFNPLMWLSYILAQKDMELSCDARVLSLSQEDIRKAYANSLINIATKQNVFLQAGLLAFGEKDIKSRVKGVMKFKRSKLWMSVISLVIIAVLSVLLLTNGQTGKNFSLVKSKSSTITNDKLLDSLLEHRFMYVGNASNSINLLRKLPYGGNITSTSLSTEKAPYGITANYSLSNPSDLKESLLTQNALLIFSLIENVDWVTFNFETPYTYTREDLQKYFEKNLWSYSENKETFDKFFMDISSKIVVYPETYSMAMSSVMGMEINLALDSYYKKSDFNISFSAKTGSLRLLTFNKASEPKKSITNPKDRIIWCPNIETDSNEGDLVTIAISDKSGRLLVEKKLKIIKNNTINYKAEPSYDLIVGTVSDQDS